MLLADDSPFQNIDFPIVFIDEAAMCTEVSALLSCAMRQLTEISLQPVTLIPIMKGSCHVTLIGDHMQLPAIVTVSSPVTITCCAMLNARINAESTSAEGTASRQSLRASHDDSRYVPLHESTIQLANRLPCSCSNGASRHAISNATLHFGFPESSLL